MHIIAFFEIPGKSCSFSVCVKGGVCWSKSDIIFWGRLDKMGQNRMGVGRGVKNGQKISDVICGQPLTENRGNKSFFKSKSGVQF